MVCVCHWSIHEKEKEAFYSIQPEILYNPKKSTYKEKKSTQEYISTVFLMNGLTQVNMKEN